MLDGILLADPLRRTDISTLLSAVFDPSDRDPDALASSGKLIAGGLGSFWIESIIVVNQREVDQCKVFIRQRPSAVSLILVSIVMASG